MNRASDRVRQHLRAKEEPSPESRLQEAVIDIFARHRLAVVYASRFGKSVFSKTVLRKRFDLMYMELFALKLCRRIASGLPVRETEGEIAERRLSAMPDSEVAAQLARIMGHASLNLREGDVITEEDA